MLAWRQKWHLKLVHAVLCTAQALVITNAWMLDYKSFSINNSVKCDKKAGKFIERSLKFKTHWSNIKELH